MARIALGLSYQGTGWHGWQTQPDHRGVQDAVETALQRFLGGARCPTVCAGRTDSGVHALQQVIHVDVEAERRMESWVRGLNALLPDSVAVHWAHPVQAHFHARFAARSRTYLYLLNSAAVRSPLMRGRAGWVHDALDAAAMRRAGQYLVGEHDFSAFRSAECQAASPVRTLQALVIYDRPGWLLFEFRANAFLHHMVRNLMGALLMVGRGRRPPDWVADLLEQRDRRLAAPTFMPDGLYLAHVGYPAHPDLPLLAPMQALARHVALHF
ncbi:tRNA pseudouridine(38-40) synthase TruA [Castellaniella sp.]|uniref:tRNA pseudouridine(38-40) synthase TruA n=1 Tax=Castellaniella sp. TaxID=1955812 RepID=UPI003569BA9A